MDRRTFLRLAPAPILIARYGLARATRPLLFHEHGHGLAFSPDGKVLLAPSEKGLAAYEDGAWWEAPGPAQGFSGFSAAAHAIYASGRAHMPGAAPAGLMRSTDGGRTWQAVALGGQADFRLIAAGYHSGAVYVLNIIPNAVMAAAGLFLTLDQGKSWHGTTARGLDGEIHALAAHPKNAQIVAVGTGAGLYLSRDAGESFARLDRSEAVTALTFDHEGGRLLYARALSNDVIDRSVEGSARRSLRLPRLARDYVTCLAHSPVDERTMAFATRRRDVYLTRDGGRSWSRIASEGEASGTNEEEARHPGS